MVGGGKNDNKPENSYIKKSHLSHNKSANLAPSNLARFYSYKELCLVLVIGFVMEKDPDPPLFLLTPPAPISPDAAAASRAEIIASLDYANIWLETHACSLARAHCIFLHLFNQSLFNFFVFHFMAKNKNSTGNKMFLRQSKKKKKVFIEG